MKDPTLCKRELERLMGDPRNAHDKPRQEHLLRLWKDADRRESKTGANRS